MRWPFPWHLYPFTLDRMLHCRVLHGNDVTIQATWQCSLYDPYWRFYRNRDDGAVIYDDEGEYPLRAGACVLVPAWGRFRTRCGGAVRHTYLHFDPLGLPGRWVRERCTRLVALPRRAAWDAVLDGMPLREDSPWTLQLRCQAMLCEAIAEAIDRIGGDRPEDEDDGGDADRRLVDPAVRWVEEHLADPLPVDLLAGRCGVARDHFTRVFTRAMGSSPARHVAERRVAAAALLLLRGDEAIEEVAERVGFANRYHFTRVFTRILRTSPAAYRRQGRLG